MDRKQRNKLSLRELQNNKALKLLVLQFQHVAAFKRITKQQGSQTGVFAATAAAWFKRITKQQGSQTNRTIDYTNIIV